MTANDTERWVEPDELRRAAFASMAASLWDAAAQAWAYLAMTVGDESEDWRLLILCCREAGRRNDAERVGAAAIERFPDHSRVWSEWALICYATRDWHEAARRWDLVCARFPEDVDALLRRAGAAEELGRHDEAADFLARARRVSGERVDTLEATARFFDRRSRSDTAVPFWREAVRREQARPDLLEGLLISLNFAGLFDDTEREAASRFERLTPTETMLFQRARAAASRQDWPAAVMLWQSFTETYPDNADARSHLGDVLWHKQVSEALDQTEAPVPAITAAVASATPPGAQVDPKSLAMCFESLGDNCEFGIFQRHHGAEPIGMYRWAGVSVAALIDAINARFDGMGDPENTDLSGHSGDEYILRDKRGWLESHTFVPFNEALFPKIYDRQTAAVRFLRERMLQDIEEPWKIFVFKPRSGSIPEHEMRALRGALSAIGDVPLMCVRVPDDASEIGSVQRVDRGLYAANISRVSAAARKHEVDLPGWLALCQATAHAAREDGYQVGRG